MTVSDAINRALDRLGDVCANRAFKLTARIPASKDDDDIVICDGLTVAREEIIRLTAMLREAAEIMDLAVDAYDECPAGSMADEIEDMRIAVRRIRAFTVRPTVVKNTSD